MPGDSSISASFFFSSRRRHTRCGRDWSSDVCSSDLQEPRAEAKSGMPDSLGTVAGKAVGAAAQGALGAVGQQAQQLGTQKPPVKGSVGRDGENDPLRVKALQKMLNEAIEVGQLTGPPLEEDGKVSEAMLKLLDSYQRAHKLPKERLVTENSWTARRLKQNPLADARWDGHDQTIKSEVDSFNKSIKQKYPDFPGLDWRQIKAMLWQESGGPDKNRGKEWAIWPMQIGRRKADLAIEDVISGESHTDLIAPKDVRKEIANAYRQHRMTPTLNIRAAIIYLCGVAISGLAAAKDAPKLQAQLGERQSLSTFANGHGTTVENLRMLNPKIKGRERLLRPETQLTYQVTKPVWGPWELALHNYNSETRDPDYVKKILRYYEAIKKRWSADSIVSSY